MRNISSDFQNHLDGECITLCNCWRIRFANGDVAGFTDHDTDIEFDETVFEANSGFEGSQVESNNSLSPDNHEILGALQSDKITEADILSRRYDNAKVDHFVVNWSSPDQKELMHTYIIGEISRSDGVFKAELKSFSAYLDQTNMRRFERKCSANLGDQKCRVNLETGFRFETEIVQVISQNAVVVSGLGSVEPNWFAGGKIKFLSGNNEQFSVEVLNNRQSQTLADGTEITLWTPAHQTISAGDQVELVPGCDKTFATCKSKFSNQLNFRGFPHIPGSDFAISYAANSEKLDGGPLIP